MERLTRTETTTETETEVGVGTETGAGTGTKNTRELGMRGNAKETETGKDMMTDEWTGF